jgi:DedD protein
MATPISEEELQLKKRARRRLIGAIALVTVVAVFLPMVLDHEPKSVTQDINIQIPSQNAGTFTSKIVPVVPAAIDGKTEPAPAVAPAVIPAPAEPAKAPAPVIDSEAAPAKVPAAESKAKPKAKTPSEDSEAAPSKAPVAEAKVKPATETKPKPAAEPKPKPKTKPAAKADGREAGGFVVQVAALSDVEKAKQMREQIGAAGVKAYTEVVPTSGGNVTRVRAGPFSTREAAEKARDRLKELGLAGQVVPK